MRLLALILVAAPASATPVSLSLGEAIELAVAQNHALQTAKLDLETTRSQVDQAYSSVMPKVDGSASYTRNLKAPDPFAGSAAGNVFGGFESIGWLAFNEQARTDGDPATNPISINEYFQRVQQGQDAAGYNPDPDRNPFLVENQFAFSISVTQALYDGAAFAGLRAAEAVNAQQTAAYQAEQHKVVDQVTQAYYGAQLAQAQVAVLEKRVARIKANLEEVKVRVAQGVIPQFQQLSAEVELANIETAQLQAAERAAATLDQLRLTLALPADAPLRLSDDLDLTDDPALPNVGEAIVTARETRPDLQQLDALDDALEAKVDAAGAGYLPRAEAFLNLSLQGSIPDDRTVVTNPDPGDPFTFETEDRSFFADEYWFPVVNIGVRLNWNIFGGFATETQVAQARIERRQTQVRKDQLKSAIAVEITQAVRAMETAANRLATQRRNIERAALNYEHAQLRVQNGVSTQTDLRSASDQLDDSRFNHLRAIHDYLVARARFAVAIGRPPSATDPQGGA